MNDGPQTLMEAVQHFADTYTCHAYMVSLKYPDGKITCPKCGNANVGNVATRRLLQCRKQF